MKWLILLALVASCGKHTEPKAVDLHDSDGDQIQNYEESEFDKYVANVESLKEVRGVLKVYTDKQREFKFSNKYDLKTRTLNIITGNENQLRPEEYFSEWSKIKIESSEIEFKQAQYDVKLSFDTGSDTPDHVILINGNERTKLADWSQNMTLQLSATTLIDLIKGKAELAMVKKFEHSLAPGQDSNKTIKEKTYRVFYDDGASTKVYYVSKDLSFNDFLAKMKVDISVVIDEDYLFFSRGMDEKLWFSREMHNGDKVVVKNSVDVLRETFLKRFTYNKTTIERLNGKSNNSLNFQNKEGAKIYVRFKSFYKTNRTFAETQEVRGGGGGGREGNANGRCTIHRRLVKNDQVQMLNIEDLAQEIMTPDSLVQERVEMRSDDTGTYWDMKLDATDLNSTLMFKPLPTNSYVITGVVRSSCDSTGGTQSTNPEGKLSLEVESYVEKID